MKKYVLLFTILLVGIFALAACGSNDPGEEVSLAATVVQPTSTPTPLPTRNVLLTRPTMTPLPTRDQPVVTTYSAEESAPGNTWLKWYPPEGWQTAVGSDGAIISPDLANPNMPYTTIRRWAQPVTVDAWQSYLPQAEVEPNSHVALQMGGYKWGGVFVICPEYTCRAMFAVTDTDNAPALSLLVYIPSGVDLTSTTDPKATLYDIWDTEAAKLNTTLQTLSVIPSGR